MTDYSRLRLSYDEAPNQDFSDSAFSKFLQLDFTDKKKLDVSMDVTTQRQDTVPSDSVEVSDFFSAVDFMLVENTHATGGVVIDYFTVMIDMPNTVPANYYVFDTASDYIECAAYSGSVVEEGALPGMYLAVEDAEDTTNDGVYLLSAVESSPPGVTGQRLSVDTSVRAIGSDNTEDSAAHLYVLKKNSIRLEAGEFAIIPNVYCTPTVADYGVVAVKFYADNGLTSSVSVTIVGD